MKSQFTPSPWSRLMRAVTAAAYVDKSDVADLTGHDDLCSAVKAFNKRRGPTSWSIDYARVIVVDQARFEEYLATDFDGLPDVRYRSPFRGSADPGHPPALTKPEEVAA